MRWRYFISQIIVKRKKTLQEDLPFMFDLNLLFSDLQPNHIFYLLLIDYYIVYTFLVLEVHTISEISGWTNEECS